MSIYVLDFPRPDEWINANTREHWAVKAAKVRAWRAATAHHAMAGLVPPMTRVEIVAQPRWASRRRHDSSNIAPTVKACVDGLVDAGVLTDDSSRIVVSESYQEGPPARGVARLRLILVDRSECAGPFSEATWGDHQRSCGPCGVPFWRLGEAS